MPPLPPIPLESYKSWASKKWSEATSAVIDALPAQNWALEAERSIAGLGDVLRGLQPPAPPPPPEPAPVSMTLPEEAPSAFAPTPPPPAAAPPVLGGLQDLGQRATSGLGGLNTRATGQLNSWADRAQEQIDGLGAGLSGVLGDLGTGWQSATAAQQAMDQTTQETTERERGTTYAQPGGELPGGWTAPETGTPEGEAITSRLAQTATEQTPGGAFVTGAARALAPFPRMTADTPAENAVALALGPLAGTTGFVGNVAQAGTRAALERLPGGETSVFEGQRLPEFAPFLGGQALTRETPILGGLTTPDELIPFLVGLRVNEPEDLYRIWGSFSDVLRASPAAMRAYLAKADEVGLGRQVQRFLTEESGELRLRGLRGGPGERPVPRLGEGAALPEGVPPPPDVPAVRPSVTDEAGLGVTRSTGQAPFARAGLPETPPAASGAVLEAAVPAAAARSRVGDLASVTTGLGLANPTSLAFNLSGGVVRTVERLARELAGETGNPSHALTDIVGMAAALTRALARFPRDVWAGPTERSRALVGATLGQGLENRRITRQLTPENAGNVAATAGTIGTRVNTATDALIRALNEAGMEAVERRRGTLGVDPTDAAERIGRAGDFSVFAGTNTPLATGLANAGRWMSDPTKPLGARAVGAFVYGAAPYVRMPERLLAASLSTITDPVGQVPPLVRAIRGGDTEAMREARARILVGAGVDTLLALKYYAGELRGSPPRDAKERRRREANGERFDTIDVGGVPVPLRSLGSIGQAASGVATTLDAVQRAVERGDDPGEILKKGGSAAARWTLQESYLRDLARFGSSVLNDQGADWLERAAANLVTRPASALAPLNAMDPYEREAQGFLGQAASRVPGARQLLPAQVDPTTGEAQLRAGTGLSRATGEYGEALTPEARELARLELAPRSFEERELKYAGATQDATQKRALQQAYGSETGRALRTLLASDAYRQAPDAQKTEMARRALATAAKLADVRAGARVARDPANRAQYEYLAVPHYQGVPVTGAPDEIRRENLRIAAAKAQLAEFRGRYPREQAGRGDQDMLTADPAAYNLARRPAMPTGYLDQEKAKIRQRVGVAPQDDPDAVILAGTVSP